MSSRKEMVIRSHYRDSASTDSSFQRRILWNNRQLLSYYRLSPARQQFRSRIQQPVRRRSFSNWASLICLYIAEPSNESSVLPHPSTLPTSSTTSLSNSSSGASTPPTVESAISANRSAFQSLSHPYLSNLSSEKDNDLASTISLTESDLDPTDTTTTSRANFYATGKNETMDDVTKAGMEDLSSKARSNAGPSAEPSATRRAASYGDRLRSASSLSASNPFLHPPNTIMLLWSFAHLEGTFEVDDGLIKAAEFVEVKKSLVAGFGSGLGGGTLEADGAGSTGWKSWIWGGAGKEGEKTGVEKGKRAGATLEERKINTMRERTIPTFSSPPSILGVDLVLAPGESKTCKSTHRHIEFPNAHSVRRLIQHSYPSRSPSIFPRESDQVLVSSRRRHESNESRNSDRRESSADRGDEPDHASASADL